MFNNGVLDHNHVKMVFLYLEALIQLHADTINVIGSSNTLYASIPILIAL